MESYIAIMATNLASSLLKENNVIKSFLNKFTCKTYFTFICKPLARKHLQEMPIDDKVCLSLVSKCECKKQIKRFFF